MTSNIGSQFLADGIDEDIAEERVLGALRDHFRPEFLNRVDEIVVFRRLDREQLAEIVELQAGRLRAAPGRARRRAGARPTAARELLGQRGLRPGLRGAAAEAPDPAAAREPARPEVLAGEVRDGDHVVVDVEGDDLTFTVAQRAEAAA